MKNLLKKAINSYKFTKKSSSGIGSFNPKPLDDFLFYYLKFSLKALSLFFHISLFRSLALKSTFDIGDFPVITSSSLYILPLQPPPWETKKAT
jgi:hypothetical protein